MSTSKSEKPVDATASSERFLFETSFDTDQMGIAGSQDEAAEPVLSDADLDQARASAYAEGEAAGRQDAVDSIEKQLLNGLGRLVEQMGALTADHARFQDSVTERSVELALKAIHKLFPTLAVRGGLEEIEALLADCLQEAKVEPRVLVRAAETQVEPLQERIDALAAKAGHEGSTVVLADDTLGPSDCRVEWAEGGAERVVEHMWREFEEATQRIFKSPGDELDSEPPEAAPEETPAASEQTEFEPESESEPAPLPDSLDAPQDGAMANNGHAEGGTTPETDLTADPPATPVTNAAGAPADPDDALADPAAVPDPDPPQDPMTAN